MLFLWQGGESDLMRIGMTYDLKSEYLAMGYSKEDAAEFDREDTIEGIEASLRELGHEPVRIGHVRTLTQKLASGERWDLVFNIAEGVSGFSREAQVPALLEAYEIPYTGSDPLTLAVSHHKGFTKQIVGRAGVPTPAFAVVASLDDVNGIDLPFPLFVKPVAEGTGKGINALSRVDSRKALAGQCEYVLATFHQPALVETFLPGREITVGLLGSGLDAQVVGAIEILPLDGAESHAYTFFNKENYEEVIRYALVSDQAMMQSATRICCNAWAALGGRDFCRMDLRADERGNLSFLEVNALPGLNPTHSDLPIICKHLGVPFTHIVGSVVASARQRYGL
jgi:D-alanine-D-alanine ligase